MMLMTCFYKLVMLVKQVEYGEAQTVLQNDTIIRVYQGII